MNDEFYNPEDEYVSDLWDEIDTLKKQNAALLDALKAVEWVWVQGASIQFCPWCDNGKILGHARNCKRQQAIAKAEGDA